MNTFKMHIDPRPIRGDRWKIVHNAYKIGASALMQHWKSIDLPGDQKSRKAGEGFDEFDE